MDDFYLYLHCGDSLAAHTDNHAGDFVVDLPKTYKLDGHWGCALTVIAMSTHTEQKTDRLYVCSNLIKESYVKDTFLPMLRSVPTTNEETLDLEFSTPYYTPIRHRGLNRVRIFMRGDRLNPCRFKLNRLYCTLRQEEFIRITRVASSWVAVRVGVLTRRKWNW